MFDLDQWQEVFNTLLSNKLRTFLTALGVSWGIFMLIIMMGAGNGLETGAMAEFRGSATNSVFIWTQRTTVPYRGLQAGRFFSMKNADYEAFKELLPDAKHIAPRNQLGGFRGGNNVIRGDKTGAFQVMGDYPQIQHIEGIFVDEGRFLNMKDITDYRKICVIGERVAELMFEERENPIGEFIQINGINFMVVGLFSTKKSGNDAERDTQRIFIPFSTFQRSFNYGNTLSWFALTSKDEVPASQMEAKALRILKSRHLIAPEDERAFGHFNLEEEFGEIQQVFSGIDFISWVVALLTLFAGAVGITNIMLVIVKERTKEIGIRRALGAKPWKIISQIMLESVFLTFMAGYAGLMIGMGLIEGAGFLMRTFELDLGMFQAPFVDVSLVIISLAVLIFAGLLAGLIPASRAVRIRPVEALRAD
ncbi:MAG: ABC transporter permease [Bacteroidota bacterium]